MREIISRARLRSPPAAVSPICDSIRAHFVARQHTNLIAIVAEEERNHFIMLVKVKRNGEYALTQRLTLETQNAEQKLQARKQRERADHSQRQGHHAAQRQRN